MPISLRAGVIVGFAVAAWTVVMGITRPHATPARPREIIFPQ